MSKEHRKHMHEAFQRRDMKRELRRMQVYVPTPIWYDTAKLKGLLRAARRKDVAKVFALQEAFSGRTIVTTGRKADVEVTAITDAPDTEERAESERADRQTDSFQDDGCDSDHRDMVAEEEEGVEKDAQDETTSVDGTLPMDAEEFRSELE